MKNEIDVCVFCGYPDQDKKQIIYANYIKYHKTNFQGDNIIQDYTQQKWTDFKEEVHRFAVI